MEVTKRSEQLARFLEYQNGELRWALGGGGEAGRLKEADIISITRRNRHGWLSSEGQYYCVDTLSEDATDSPCEILRFVFVNKLPQHLLDKYLVPSIPDHLKCDATHRLTVVVSTHSGTCQAKTFYSRKLKHYLKYFGLKGAENWSPDRDRAKYQLILTKSDQTVKDLGKELSQASPSGPARTIILLSGDGGVVDLINGNTSEEAATSLPTGPKPTIALIPLGTGNALFHSLHKPLYSSGPTEPSPCVLALRTLFRGVARPLPTFEAVFAPGSRLISYSDGDSPEEETRSVTRLVGAIVASYGFHASLVWESDTPAYRKHGAARFQMAAAELLKLGHAYEVDVEVRASATPKGYTSLGESYSPGVGGRFGYVLATLVSSLEKTFTISPDSRPLDGQLRLVTFGNVDGEKTMDIMKAAYDGGKHVKMKWEGKEEEEGVGYVDVEEVRIRIWEEEARWRKVCIDGTIVELPASGGWMMVKKVPESRFDILVDGSVV